MSNNNEDDVFASNLIRRAVSLEPRRGIQVNLHVNPHEQASSNEMANSAVRRQVSEPGAARDRLVRMVKKSTTEFLGLEDESDDKELWTQRRMRLFKRRCELKKSPEQNNDQGRPYQVEEGGDEVDGDRQYDDQEEEESINREPVYKLTLNGIAHVTNTLSRRLSLIRAKKDKPKQFEKEMDERNDSVFYSSSVFPDDVIPDDFFSLSRVEDADVTDAAEDMQQYSIRNIRPDHPFLVPKPAAQKPSANEFGTWQIQKDPLRGIPSKIIDLLYDNSDRRVYGLGVVGKLFDRKLKKNLTKEQQEAIDHIDDHRPYFTYWVTTVQILILIISLASYGFGPFGFGGRTQISNLVLVTSLSYQQVDYFEADNFWIGPRAADLIHLGAKFTPCMRKDKLVYDAIQVERNEEKSTACCVRNDQSGCVQTTEEKCSPLLSTWIKWTDTDDGPEMKSEKSFSSPMTQRRRTSGSICGQDPRFCEEPASVPPYEWPDDITKWPICKKKVTIRQFSSQPHMTCEVVGRPCCIGIYGECRITTLQYCNFVKGFFHEDAALCSQVSCMADICGMLPFYSNETPNQFYRLWTSLFLHAGILHLLITVLLQFYVMRDLEKLMGSLRIIIIYLGAGFCGNLASSIFIPYRAEVGPSGSQFGLLACLIVEVWYSRDIIVNPAGEVIRLCGVAFALFAIGLLLPWVDNYAHIFGFLAGFFLSVALLPYLKVQENKSRALQVKICFLVLALMIAVLFLVFYDVIPFHECEFCSYINCIPFSKHWCADQTIKITRIDIL